MPQTGDSGNYTEKYSTDKKSEILEGPGRINNTNIKSTTTRTQEGPRQIQNIQKVTPEAVSGVNNTTNVGRNLCVAYF